QSLLAFETTLLGLEHKAVALVKIDALMADRCVAPRFPDHAFENIVICRGCMRGDIWVLQIKQIAQFGEEHGVVGALLPAILRLPTLQEVLNPLRHALPPPAQ